MKFIATVALSVIVTVFAADYVRQGTVEGVALAREHMCRWPLYYVHQQGTPPMTVTIVKHSYYKIEIDTVDAPQQPIVYFRKEGKCKTAKGMERQHNRIVNETVRSGVSSVSRSVATLSLVSLLASMWQHDRSILLT